MGGQLFHKRTLQNTPFHGETVLVRVDYNVPIKNGKITNDFRIRASVPLIRFLLNHGCKVVIMSHLGRPDGKKIEEYSLEPIADRLEKLLKQPVTFIPDCIGSKVRMGIKRAPKKSVILLENLRFYPEEEHNDMDFARQLVHDTGAKIFIQDGFGVVHRAHASTEAIAQCIPGVAGPLVEHEYKSIVGALQKPKRPLVALLGGAKVSDKIQVIERFITLADQIVIGGAMANTFLAYKGHPVGVSKRETGVDDLLARIYKKAADKVGAAMVDNFIVLPIDVAVGRELSNTESRRDVALEDVAEDEYILDIGEKSIERVARAIKRAQTVVWNGTMGMTEFPEFAHGSARAALEIVQNKHCISIIGGGDTAGFVETWDSLKGKSFTHVSTGGGAGLDLMAGKKLPGIEALLDA